MKILIIGGTGNISTPITRMMQGKGHDITLFNFDQMRPEWLLPEVKVIIGNRKDLPKYEQQVFLNLKGIKMAHRNIKLTLNEENSRRNIY